jgi:phosphoribosylanthranilate isomerase
MTRIKICGIRDKTAALAAVESGADFIGLVFAPSSRQVSPTQAREIVGAVKKTSEAARIVGVFVNAPSSQTNEVADFCALDWVQLSGDEPWEYCHAITRPVIKAARMNRLSAERVCDELSLGARSLPAQRFIALLDSRVKGKYGGTGESFDWDLAQEVAKRFPVMIAGGLDPTNVAGLIEKVSPWGVDVSSGVETGGVKDKSKIKAFIEAVKKADGKR